MSLALLAPDSTGLIGGNRRPLSSTEIAKEIELGHPTVLTALMKAVGNGLLVQNGETFAFATTQFCKSQISICEITQGVVENKEVMKGVTHSGDDDSNGSPPGPPSSLLDSTRRDSLLRESLLDAKIVPKTREKSWNPLDVK